jgi:protein required for attachment to host cells
MPLPNKALVLVADGRKMLFLRNHGDAAQIDLRVEAHDEQALFKDSDMKSDSPGVGHQSGGYGRATVAETDYHQQAEDRWAVDAADRLRKRALNGDFDALAIVAPPRTLGELRKHLHKEVEKRVVIELAKEMTDRPIPDIQALFEGQAASPA